MLKVNHGHKKINTSSLKKSGIKILSQLMGATVALTMYSGFASLKASATSYSSSSSSHAEDEISIPDDFRDSVLEALGRTSGSISKSDLKSIEKLELITLNDKNSLSFLYDCSSIKDLYIGNLAEDITQFSKLNRIDTVDTFTFDNGADTIDLNIENCKFLYKNPNIKKLQLYGYVMLEPELVYSMPNLESVAIDVRETVPLDLKKIPNLKEAYIYGDPYDISINITVDDINYLLNNGVEVFLNNDSFDQMQKIDKRLDDIIASMGIDKNSSNKEKLDAIIVYALKHFTYDPTIDSMSVHDPSRDNAIKKFYQDGYLYGALEKDTQLCGNYAAFFTAIATRIGLESYMMMSDVHCWNLVKVDGDFYYIDTTWMDCNYYIDDAKYVRAEELFDNNKQDGMEWYMDKPKSYTDYDHQSYNYPEYLNDELDDSISRGVYGDVVQNEFDTGKSYVAENTYVDSYSNDVSVPVNIVSQNDEPSVESTYTPIRDISDQEYEFMVNGTLVGVPAALLIGLMTAIGAAKVVKKKKKERQMQRDLERYYSEDNNHLKM